ncbi:MAG: hypothetical protein WAO20_09680 [Acidobacteriota bacterium]
MEVGDFFQREAEAVLRIVRPFEVHGAQFYEIGFSLVSDPPDSVRRARVSDNLVYADPKPGDRVKIALLMGNVTRIVKTGN